MERALATRKDAQAAQLEAQRKAIPGIQTALGKGNADAARAAAAAAGIEDFGEATPQAKQIEMGDDAMGMGEALPPPPDPNAKKRYGFSVGDQRQEFELAPPVDNTAAAATITGYLKHSDPAIKRAAGTYRALVELGKETPGRAVAKLATMEAQIRGQNASSANSRRSTGIAGQRLSLDREKATAAVEKGDPANDRAIRNTIAGSEGINLALDRLDELLQEGKSLPFTELGERKSTAQGTIALRLKDAEEMGALDAGVSTAVGKIIGSAFQSHATPGLARAKVDEARRYLKAQQEAKLRALRASKDEIRTGRPMGAPESAPKPAPSGRDAEEAAIDAIMRMVGGGK